MPATIIWEGIAGLVLCLGAAVLAIYFYGRMCRDNGFEEGRADAYDEIDAERAAAELADRHATRSTGRHAAGTAPRRELARPPHGGQPPWYTEIPGRARIQPGRNSGDGTLTFPRVQLTDATTGEIRAIGDANVAAIEAAVII